MTRRRSPSTLHVHHNDSHTTTSRRRNKSFHVLCVDRIGKVWEVIHIAALINIMLTVMMILLLK
jgi:hypothetical protein